ncbi:hypothetical protein GL4_2940 [Methyloceanibacter caenitepidi]|uniref:Uncharacterized protein n=1 Tax=Methyloceanibacter caenitepidi TaxID=1384459 RepID=A0A0A8K7A3_9HYPH|nr:hypothetical protein GL4_2940 [Methyloceanibacter caenitepidi]
MWQHWQSALFWLCFCSPGAKVPAGTGLAVRVVQMMPAVSDPLASMAAWAVDDIGITSDWSSKPQIMMSPIKSRSLRSQRIGVLEFLAIPVNKDNANGLWLFAKFEVLI